ncbi:hypothetical protein OROGR_010928 [Orobanche gracilis]
MVGFKNRYMVMEVFLDPNKDFSVDEPVIITQFNLSKAIKDSILTNFGECGLASCMNSTSREEYQKVWAAITMVKSIGNCPVVLNLLDLSGSIRACRNAALKCDESKFEHYKLSLGDRLPAGAHQQMLNCLEKIKILEH